VSIFWANSQLQREHCVRTEALDTLSRFGWQLGSAQGTMEATFSQQLDRHDGPNQGGGATVTAATGDYWVPPTWDEVVREHSARVYRLAYRLSGNRQDAEDLTQETFVRVFRSLANYTPGTFEGWLHRITTNLFLDMAETSIGTAYKFQHRHSLLLLSAEFLITGA